MKKYTLFASLFFLSMALTPLAEAQVQSRTFCIVVGDSLVYVAGSYDPDTRDTTVAGKPISQVHPTTTPPYAVGAEWYQQDDDIVMNERPYEKYGFERVLSPREIEKVGEYKNIPLFADPETEPPYESIFIPTRRDCFFYQYNLKRE